MTKELKHTISFENKGKLLDGDKKYKLHLSANIPASTFWSIIVYESISRLIIRSGQSWPSVYSTNKKLVINNDGSVDAWFSPKPILGKESNWVKTIPGHQWFLILRLYYPLESWLDKTWRPGEIEESE